MRSVILVSAIILIVFTFCDVPALAQENLGAAQTSDVEAFSSRDGVLLERQFIDVGKFKKCEIQVVVFTDLLTQQGRKGVRFSMEVASSYTVDTKIALLDPEEVDALIQSLKIIIEEVMPTTRVNYTEIAYTSRDGFQAGCYWSKKKAWEGFMRLERFDRDSNLWFNADEFASLLSILEEAKLQL